MISETLGANRRLLPPAAAAALGFVLLTVADWHRQSPLAIDARWTADLVNQPATNWFRFGEDISFIGSGGVVVVIAVVAAALLWRSRRQLVGSVMVLAAAVGGGASEVIAKKLIERPRPLTMTFTGESGFGFPSGHTTGFTAVVVAIALALGLADGLKARWWHWAIVAAASVAVAVARVDVGAHYVFDVLAGLLLGTLVAIIARVLAPVVTPLIEQRVPARWR